MTSANKRKKIAERYFEAFHEGDLDEVFKYLSKECTVQYGNQSASNAKEFFENTKDLIASLKFEQKGTYTSKDDRKVLIYFSFKTPKTANKPSKTVEAVDIIKFNSNNQIEKIQVISNE